MKTFGSDVLTHLNRGIMVVDEVVLDILESERGLTHSAVTEHHNAVPGVWRNDNNMTHDKIIIIVEEIKTTGCPPKINFCCRAVCVLAKQCFFEIKDKYCLPPEATRAACRARHDLLV